MSDESDALARLRALSPEACDLVTAGLPLELAERLDSLAARFRSHPERPRIDTGTVVYMVFLAGINEVKSQLDSMDEKDKRIDELERKIARKLSKLD